MHIEQARALKAALDTAIEQAEQAGSTEVNLQGNLQALDDAARADLQAAIDAAAKS